MGIYLIEIIKDRRKELAASIICKRKFGKNLTSIMGDLLNKTAASAQQITMQTLQSVSSICLVLKMLLKYYPGKKPGEYKKKKYIYDPIQQLHIYLNTYLHIYICVWVER